MISKIRSASAVSSFATTLAFLSTLGCTTIERQEPDREPLLPGGAPGHQIEVANRRVRVIDRGAGSAIVLVHGVGGTAAHFGPVIDALGRRYRVIALDLFGMGFSERSSDFRYGWNLWADQIAGVLDTLGIERAHVVGHSLGGTVGIVFADRYPHRIGRLVLVGSASWLPGYFFAMLTPGVGEWYLARKDFLGAAYDDRHRSELEAAYRVHGTRRAILRYSRRMVLDSAAFSRAVDRLAIPVLQLHGTADQEVPLRAAERFRARLRDSRLVAVEGSGHYVMRDAPGRFVEEVLAFLAD